MLLSTLERTWQNAQKRAKSKGTPFEIAYADVCQLWDAQGGRCALSGRELLVSATALTGVNLLDLALARFVLHRRRAIILFLLSLGQCQYSIEQVCPARVIAELNSKDTTNKLNI